MKQNNNFRSVLNTSNHNQSVSISLKPNEFIGDEFYSDTGQFALFENGHVKCKGDGKNDDAKEGDAVIIPAGSGHNVINTDPSDDLKVYTIYSPSPFKYGIKRKTKKEAQEKEEELDGVTIEGCRL